MNPGLVSPDSPAEQAQTRQRTVHTREALGNEGFVLSPGINEQADRFRQTLEGWGKQGGEMLSGHERDTRFALGISAKDEETRSVLGTYLEAKRDSDSITHADEARHIRELAGTRYGQGVMDIAHSGAAGTVDTGSKALTYGYLATKPLSFLLDRDAYQDPDTGTVYKDDLTAYLSYPLRRYLYEKKQAQKAARSEEYRQTGLRTHPGYLPVKAAGTALEDLLTTLAALWITRRLDPADSTAAGMVVSAVSDYSSGYDKTVAEWMDKSEEEMEQNGVYRELRRRGIPGHQARFIIGHTLGEKQAKINALVGAVRAYAVSVLGGITRTGTESGPLRFWQDKGIDWGIGEALDYAEDKLPYQNNNKDN